MRPYEFADGVLPKIHISGCPSSCSAHQSASLGFRGAVKQSPEGPKPAYAIFEGGCSALGKENFGADAGIMAEDKIPLFLIELGQTISRAHTVYDSWIKENHGQLLQLIAEYTK